MFFCKSAPEDLKKEEIFRAIGQRRKKNKAAFLNLTKGRAKPTSVNEIGSFKKEKKYY